MPKKQSKEKKEKPKEKQEKKEEESELEEEIEKPLENVIVKEESFQQFLKPIESKTPILERVEEAPKNKTLEENMDFMAGPKPEEEKQEKNKMYDLSQITKNYEAEVARQEKQKITPAMERQFVNPEAIRMDKLGRIRQRIGHEANLLNPDELMPTGDIQYDAVSIGKKEDFQGEKAGFQENLEKRYDFKK